MYVPLAAVLSLVVVGVFLIGRRRGIPKTAAIVVLAGIAGVFGSLTYRRNQDYSSEERIWMDTIEKRPSNPRARINYGVLLLNRGEVTAAEPHLRAAVALDPDEEDAHLALGGGALLHRALWRRAGASETRRGAAGDRSGR
jgi:Tfp pilus assembly protein PilF